MYIECTYMHIKFIYMHIEDKASCFMGHKILVCWDQFCYLFISVPSYQSDPPDQHQVGQVSS